MSHFEVYGDLAAKDVEDTCQNGRYSIQKDAEANIPEDVIAKLKIQSSDSFLDIGCGLGLNLGPVAKIAQKVVGCDHQKVVEKAESRIKGSNITLVGGNFLELGFDGQFDKILAYSVLPALPDGTVLYHFIDKALSLLKPSGRMLLGDLSNADKKQRFVNSERGKKFLEDWNKNYIAQSSDQNLSSFSDAGPAVEINDEFVLTLLGYIRKQGFHAYLMDQPQNLPFGNSREDILVVGSEYDEGFHD